jgi:hypothetical protein
MPCRDGWRHNWIVFNQKRAAPVHRHEELYLPMTNRRQPAHNRPRRRPVGACYLWWCAPPGVDYSLSIGGKGHPHAKLPPIAEDTGHFRKFSRRPLLFG